ncbi:MAG TPA: helix-turn-helix domain-containing protein, partial [Myxococcota bacterium]
KERTKSLTDAALKLFLERGIGAVTIEDITTSAGVAKGSFYRYFDDKQAIVEELLAPLYDVVSAAFEQSFATLKVASTPADVVVAYEQLAEGFLKLLLEAGDIALLYLQENRGPARGPRAPVVRLAELIVDKGIEHTAAVRAHGILRPFPAELSTLAVIGAAEVILYRMLSGTLQSDPLEAAGQLIVLVLDGIRNPAAGALFAHDRAGA